MQTRGAHEPDTTEQEQARTALVEIKEAVSVKKDKAAPLAVSIEGFEQTVQLPHSVVKLLVGVLSNYAAGQGVTIVPAHAELTTQQAADMLNVSRPYLVKLLGEGKINHKMVGTHRRIPASAVIEYRAEQEIETRGAADELVALDQEMGLY